MNEVPPDGLFDVAYNISINERQEVQLSLVDFRPNAEAVIEIPAEPLIPIDWRGDPDAHCHSAAVRTAIALWPTSVADVMQWGALLSTVSRAPEIRLATRRAEHKLGPPIAG